MARRWRPIRRSWASDKRSTYAAIAALPVASVVSGAVRVFRSGELADALRPAPLELYLYFWPAYVVVFIAWTARKLNRLEPDALRAAARLERGGRRRWWTRFFGSSDAGSSTLLASLFAMLITVTVAQQLEYRGDPVAIALGLVAVAASWALMIYSFALDHLLVDVRQREAGRPALDFHLDEPARFTDYVTFTFLVSTMAALISADVRTREAWRLVRVNVVFAFAFNSVVVAMLVSLLVGGLTGS